jgi:LysM repeat protein
VTPSPVPTPAPSYQTYTVKSGDTLYAIARRFGVTVTAITDLNGITRDKILHSGDVLLIPNP